jgi:hypothetical protein
MQFLAKQQVIHKLVDNKALNVVTKGVGRLSYGFDLWHEGNSMYDHMRDGDYIGVLSDGKDVAASTLKTFGGPAAYLVGYNISVWSDVATEARKVDWAHLPSANDWVEYGPGALKDAVLDVGNRMIFKWA